MYTITSIIHNHSIQTTIIRRSFFCTSENEHLDPAESSWVLLDSSLDSLFNFNFSYFFSRVLSPVPLSRPFCHPFFHLLHQIGSTGAESGPITATTFVEGGDSMVVASSDSLKVWGWDPNGMDGPAGASCTTHLDCAWHNVQDIHMRDENRYAPTSREGRTDVCVCVGGEAIHLYVR